MKTKTTRLPRLLVIRPDRVACRDFYSKFKKFDVVYLTVDDHSESKENFKIVNTSYYPRIGKVNNLSWAFMKDMEKYIKETDVVCISDNYYFYNLQAVMLAKKYNKKIVTILWATIPNHISTWLPPYSLITKKVVAASDLFILRNRSALNFALSIGAPKNKTKVIYKGIDLDRFYPSKKIVTSKPMKFVGGINILYVGKLIKSKGVFDLIKAFDMLVADGLNVKLSLVGSGKVKNISGDRIKILGFVPYHKLPGIYREAYIFCAPSKEIKFLGIKIWEEYFSYTLMEAQASGLPIVTTKSVGVVEEVDSRNQFVEVGDVKGLYKTLRKLVESGSLRQKLGRINRRRAEEFFDAKSQAQKTEEEMLKLC
jgi:glycosyltransferase involved in cell wall biosynthesis